MSSRTRRTWAILALAMMAALLAAVPAHAAPTCGGRPATHTGTSGADVLTGTPGIDVIVGLGGNDVIRGLGGDDVVCGGAGHDRIFPGAGDDLVFGQSGRDTVDYGTSPTAVTVSLLNGRAIGDGSDRLYSIEHIGGSTHRDVLEGDGGANRINGRGGGDTIRGFGGADRLVGEHGWDRVFGGSGSDFCLGERTWSCSSGNTRLVPAGEPAAFGPLMPLYAVEDPSSRVEAVSFARGWADGATTITAIDINTGAELWTNGLGSGTGFSQLFGGFDFDDDGWIDVGSVRATQVGTCGPANVPLLDTSLVFFRGRTGELVEGTNPEPAICWVYGYPTETWGILGVLFGDSTSTMALSRYFQHPAGDPIVPVVPDGDEPMFVEFSDAGLSEVGVFQYPSTPVFGETYPNSQPNPWGAPYDHQWNSHVANGLIVEVDDAPRLLFFTSGRVVQYAVGPLGPDQLLVDHPYLTGGRTDIGGRTYGLVAVDPNHPDHVVLLSGATASSVWHDMRNGKEMVWDRWGNIERHLTIYDYVTDELEDRFFSYAHNGGWGQDRTEGRLTFPDNPFASVGDGLPSRVAYNVFDGGRWHLHVSQPGSTADSAVIEDRFLWDIVDVDDDGVDEWLVSPAPGGYTPAWQTDVYTWDEVRGRLVLERSLPDGVPYLAESFRQPTRSSSFGYLYPVATASTRHGVELFLIDEAGDVHGVVLGS